MQVAKMALGDLLFWENWMPMARYAVYRGGPRIWVEPTADDSEGWLASMRHIGIESGARLSSRSRSSSPPPRFRMTSPFPFRRRASRGHPETGDPTR
jgi:hypothetical protein